MLHHIVWWTFKEEAEGASAAQNMAKVKASIEELRGKIPSLLQLEMSDTVLPTSTRPAQLVLHTVHDNAAGLHAYAEHPLHVAVLPFVKAVVASREALDFEV
ncbi:Dabb family protein [Desulfovibrio cuneatus]|uniref:Dabb family protein n=1 Tax=Desulfovibrio cuneatus TaxID=159728 RepID=UPI000417CF46|nr:Dabb family protein [Desulfovibrio cuneatus]